MLDWEGPNHGDIDVLAADSLKLRDLTRKAARKAEEQLIRSALKSLSGNVSAVARHVGISPRAVHQKLRKLDINPQEYRKA
jgi:Nif-specific regulatory protein/two-component system response regulator AtoC